MSNPEYETTSAPPSRSSSMATSTLIRLYLEQGHLDKANQLLNARLDHDPHDAEALALQARIDQAPIGVLKSRLEGSELRLRWRVWPGSTRSPKLPFLLRIHFFSENAEGETTTTWQDLECNQAVGQCLVALPPRPQPHPPWRACVGCLVSKDQEDAPDPTSLEASGSRFLAIGRVHRWGD